MNATLNTARSSQGFVWPLVANLLAVLPLLVALALHESSRDAYYQAVQEDEFLEWATVWAFAVAAVIFAVAAVRQRRASGALPWFLAGVSLFCVFVAGEEISWGQRVLGYRPPVYFLQENFQQELNIHNVVDTSLRKLALKGVILGYGVLLPLLALAAPVRRQLDRLAVVASPWQLAPAFLVTWVVYQQYPLKFTGEVIELMVGLGFLFASLVAAETFAGRPETGPRRLGRLALVVAIVAALGLAAAAYSRGQRGTGEEILAAVVTETAALKDDFLTMARDNRGKAVTRCGVHKRVYSFVEKYDTDYLYEGAFAALTGQGMPTERAEFFLDPWNSPYWIRDECSRRRGSRVIFVYSFGPNRKRESTEWELQGDDVGAVIFQLGR